MNIGDIVEATWCRDCFAQVTGVNESTGQIWICWDNGEDGQTWWPEQHFKLKEKENMSEFKTGDKVKFINDIAYSSSGFTFGNVYEVGGQYQIMYEDNGESRIGVVADDRGKPNGWNKEFFEKVESVVIDFKVGKHYIDNDGDTVLCIHRQDTNIVFYNNDGSFDYDLDDEWDIENVLSPFKELPPLVLDQEKWAVIYDCGGIPSFVYTDTEEEANEELQYYINDDSYENVRIAKIRVTEIV